MYNTVKTSAAVYPSLNDTYQITFNTIQSVWDWNAYEIIHQTTSTHHITREEALDIITELTKVLEKLEDMKIELED